MSITADNVGTRSSSRNSLSAGQLRPLGRYGILAAAIMVGILAAVSLGWFDQGGLNVMEMFGLVTLTGLCYITAVAIVSTCIEGRRQAVDRIATACVITFFLLALIPLVSLLWTVTQQGLTRLDPAFFTESMRGVFGGGGGAVHAVVGTFIVTAISTVISVPVGVLTAIYLVEYGNNNRLSRALTFFVDVMTGIPSIVAGLFAYALFALLMGPGARAGIIGAAALCILMIPIVVRNTEEMLRIVPSELREAAYALGVPKWLTIVKVVLRTAIAGIATGVTIAIARIIGETAPLLVTIGITTSVNWNPFSGRMAVLPVFSYYQYMNPGVPPQPYIDRAWTAALLLMIIVMALNLVARWVSHVFAPKAR
ncbi:phosphate ABC transporter permease PstA [Dermatophilus congolensis]|uniref:Phosphate transport system permease protein PstA n=1 Tax=Dermatophilus congolensis TaxID=1863 RepID=A0AA46BLG6_9MICO|nr:phosphate ABC transporter permease PstA [Dermatophilus congolensis]MBO3142049.1 phosphate ABC transporter permease PstA [Dermatophilus congolensis]MBO3151041.1 phosphate ABC transporter permease PstA [Dermatophilus congolensis]MBO3161955.1 phosphate ABC transporter permease PstA [Dermatophilus congolensis]MBO3162326.1 phosphate ABC transporter permease PstA [Dermatophilus congolensis]MBO3175880.1 phosphate ABC transporter permease PstA [Dermatophilus congolensis]